MCLESAYYDTCIFGESLNQQHPQYAACRRLLTASEISWIVHYCPELIAAESSLEEYVHQFEVDCAANGVVVKPVPLSDAKAFARDYRALSRKLKQYGFGGNDFSHLMAASVTAASVLVSVDPDYWDPANKANPKAKKKSDVVKRLIEDALPITIGLPSDVPGECCAEG